MQRKTKRIDLRVTSEFKTLITQLSKELRNSRNQTIEDIIEDIIFNKEQYFICCPDCNAAITRQQNGSGRDLLKCVNGHANIYNFDKSDFIIKD